MPVASTRQPRHQLLYGTIGLISSLLWLVPQPILSTQPLKGPSPQSTEAKSYGKRVGFSSQLTSVNGAPVYVVATMSAGDFFGSLQEVVTREQIEFRRNGVRVTGYPENLLVEVRMLEEKVRTRKELIPLAIAPEFMRSLQFEAKWKRDLDLRPVDSVSLDKSWDEPPEFDIYWRQWVYQLTVKTKDVPLTDHLIVYILSEDKKLITRISASL